MYVNAPEAAVFRLRLSSTIANASSISGCCTELDLRLSGAGLSATRAPEREPEELGMFIDGPGTPVAIATLGGDWCSGVVGLWNWGGGIRCCCCCCGGCCCC